MMRAFVALTPSGPPAAFASNAMDGAGAENAGAVFLPPSGLRGLSSVTDAFQSQA